MRIKAGDTYPPIRFDLNADITGATSVLVRLMDAVTGAFQLSGAATVDDAANGLGHRDWGAGETTAMAGKAFFAEVVVTFAGGAIQRFPQGWFLEVIVEEAVPAA